MLVFEKDGGPLYCASKNGGILKSKEQLWPTQKSWKAAACEQVSLNPSSSVSLDDGSMGGLYSESNVTDIPSSSETASNSGESRSFTSEEGLDVVQDQSHCESIPVNVEAWFGKQNLNEKTPGSAATGLTPKYQPPRNPDTNLRRKYKILRDVAVIAKYDPVPWNAAKKKISKITKGLGEYAQLVNPPEDGGHVFELLCVLLQEFSPTLRIANNTQRIFWREDGQPFQDKEIGLVESVGDRGTDAAILCCDGSYVIIQSKFRSNESIRAEQGGFIKDCNELGIGVGGLPGHEFDPSKGRRAVWMSTDHPDPRFFEFKNGSPRQGVFVIGVAEFKGSPDESSALCTKEFFEYVEKWTHAELHGERFNVQCNAKQLKRHQQTMIDGFVERFCRPPLGEGSLKGLMCMWCGTGKTLTSFWQMLRFMEYSNTVESVRGSVVVFVPSLYLLVQMFHAWTGDAVALGLKGKSSWLLIGSVSTKEVKKNYHTPFEVTTCREKVFEFMNKIEDKKKVVICTYQSKEVLRRTCPKFGLIIHDEAHKTAGNKRKAFADTIKDESFPCHSRLFMTATTKSVREPRNGRARVEEVNCMSDEKKYGSLIAPAYTMGMAVADGVIVPTRVIALKTENEEVTKLCRSQQLISLESEYKGMPEVAEGDSTETAVEHACLVAAALDIVKCLESGTYKRVLPYSCTIDRSKHFAKLLQFVAEKTRSSVPMDNFAHMNGSDSVEKRAKIVAHLKSEGGVICSSCVLKEGVDIPCVDTVVFLDNKNSVIDIAQCVGRPQRLFDGKEVANIVLPMFFRPVLERVEAYEDDHSAQPYGTIRHTLERLAIFDEHLRALFSVQNMVSPDDKLLKEKLLFTSVGEQPEKVGSLLNVQCFKQAVEHVEICLSKNTDDEAEQFFNWLCSIRDGCGDDRSIIEINNGDASRKIRTKEQKAFGNIDVVDGVVDLQIDAAYFFGPLEQGKVPNGARWRNIGRYVRKMCHQLFSMNPKGSGVFRGKRFEYWQTALNGLLHERHYTVDFEAKEFTSRLLSMYNSSPEESKDRISKGSLIVNNGVIEMVSCEYYFGNLSADGKVPPSSSFINMGNQARHLKRKVEKLSCRRCTGQLIVHQNRMKCRQCKRERNGIEGDDFKGKNLTYWRSTLKNVLHPRYVDASFDAKQFKNLLCIIRHTP
eukprot:Nk52_evm6s274 gene=Nk52_evmTU6s274